MQIDWFTFIAQVVNFLILIVLLQRFLYKPVVSAMDEREQKVASELEEARLKKIEAEQKEQELDQNLKEFEAQKNQLLEDARQEVDKQRNLWMEQLRADIDEIRKRWEEAVDSEKESFLSHLRRETGHQVIALIEDVLTDLSERNLQQQTLDLFFEKLKHLDDEEKENIRETMAQLKTNEAEIHCSFELDEEQKHRITDLLREMTNDDLSCEFDITKDLGFGVQIQIGGWRLSWNLKAYLDRFKQQMDRFLKEKSSVRQTTSS